MIDRRDLSADEAARQARGLQLHLIARDKKGYYFVTITNPPFRMEVPMAVVYCERGETLLIDERTLRHVLDGEQHDYEPGWLVLNAHDHPEGLHVFLGVSSSGG